MFKLRADGVSTLNCMHGYLRNTNMQSFVTKMLILLLLFIAASPLMPVASQTFDPTHGCSTVNAPVSPPRGVPGQLGTKEKIEEVTVIVSVDVPYNQDAQDQCALYPYPITAMKVDSIEELPSDLESVKEIVRKMIALSQGISGQSPPDWRVERAFKQAVMVSRKEIPHTPVGVDAWISEFVPYMQAQIMAINATEKQRQDRYGLIAGLPDDYIALAEKNASAKKLEPVSVRITQVRPGLHEGRVKVCPGSWWAVARHKANAMTYYWQQEITISDGPRLIELNEQNALIVQGHI